MLLCLSQFCLSNVADQPAIEEIDYEEQSAIKSDNILIWKDCNICHWDYE